jgi:hypothetical protein
MAVRFRASFPAIQTAIRISGDGNGMRILLDIPESDVPAAVTLLALRESVLIVTVEPELINKRKQSDDVSEGSQRQSRWEATEK